MNDDPIPFLLLAAFAVVLILTLNDLSKHQPVPVTAKAQPMDVQCGTSTRSIYDDWEPVDYDTIAEDMAQRCNRRFFPYCHQLPIPFYRALDDDYFDARERFGCERDLVPY